MDNGQLESKKVPVKRELRAGRACGRKVLKVLTAVLQKDFHEKIDCLHLRPDDRLRLTIFQSWATRHKVPLNYVLKTLVGYWRSKTRRPGKKSVLGVTLAALTSRTSEEILKARIAKDFPSGENVTQWNLNAQRVLLGLAEPRGKVKSLIDEDKPEHSCKIYGERIQRRRNKLDSAAAGQRRRRRAWRGNPWL